MLDLVITTLHPAYFAGLEELQRICYPTLGADELMTAAHFAAQYEVFAEGQIVVTLAGRVVGQGSGFFTDFDFDHPGHTFREICAGFTFANHNPGGAYYYGADISVHPDLRGQGIGRRLYAARKEVVRRHNRRGIVGGGLLPGYALHRHTLTVQEYVARVVAGDLSDPTLTFQLANGFVVRGLLQNYLEDSASDNWSTLIEWRNPEWTA